MSITIKQIAEVYHEHLAGRIFTYNVRYKDTPFHIKFDEGHLAHLLALQYFGYKRGEHLYPELLNGNITWEVLEKRNEGAFKEHQLRIANAYYMPDVMKDPKIAIYDPKKSQSRIVAEFMFYNEKNNRFLTVGIRKENKESPYFIPVTFVESKKNKWAKNKHILLQV